MRRARRDADLAKGLMRKDNHTAPSHFETFRLVMAGLVRVPARKRTGCPVPAISLRKARPCISYRDRRDKPGDDDLESFGSKRAEPL